MPIVTIDNHKYIARLPKSRLKHFVSVSKRYSLPNGRIDWKLAGIKLAMDNVLPMQCLNPANLSKMYHRLTKPQRTRKGRAGGHNRDKEIVDIVVDLYAKWRVTEGREYDATLVESFVDWVQRKGETL